jgi:biotin carboxylase
VLEDPWRDGAIPLRFEDPEASVAAIVDYAHKEPLDAIVPIGDKPTLIAALACEALGLLSHPPGAARACHDKYRFRQLLQAAGLPVPGFCRFRAQTDMPSVPQAIGFPCVLKPLSLSASRGVIRADNEQQFAAAFRRIRALLQLPDIGRMKEETAEWILVESYLPGVEVALEGIMNRGALRTLALFDKPDPLEGPYFEESIYVTPSRLPDSLQNAIVRATEQAAQAVGLFHGPIHAELRLTPGGPRVIEIAARPIGGLCARALRFEGGQSLEELILRHAVQMPLASFSDPSRDRKGADNIVRREETASGVMMIPVPAAGVLEDVHGLEDARSIAGIEDIVITAKLKQSLVPWPEGSSYLGFIFARGASPNEVETALRTAHSKLQFAITPALPVVR